MYSLKRLSGRSIIFILSTILFSSSIFLLVGRTPVAHADWPHVTDEEWEEGGEINVECDNGVTANYDADGNLTGGTNANGDPISSSDMESNGWNSNFYD